MPPPPPRKKDFPIKTSAQINADNDDSRSDDKTEIHTSIIVVHWGIADDTIECLTSLATLEDATFRIIVVDNASHSSSFEALERWAKLAVFGQPAIITQHSAGEKEIHAWHKLTIIRANKNKGYAAGVNIGIRFARRDYKITHFWILNNDVVVHKMALSALHQKALSTRKLGICGSKIIYFRDTEKIQALGGGTYHVLTGRSHLLGAFTSSSVETPEGTIEKNIQFVYGASSFVSCAFIDDVGLMNENYFAYHEELDWAKRGEDNWSLSYSHQSIVYHKHGASLGTGDTIATTKPIASYYGARSRLKFSAKYYPYALPSVICFSLMRALRAALMGKYSSSAAIVAGTLFIPTRFFLNGPAGNQTHSRI